MARKSKSTTSGHSKLASTSAVRGSGNQAGQSSRRLFREDELPSLEATEKYVRKDIEAYVRVHPTTPLSLQVLPDFLPGGTMVPHHVLIKLSIMESPSRRRTLAQIKKDIEGRFPHMKGDERLPWKASIRHKLSNEAKFVQVKRPRRDPGKGNYWVIHIGQEKKKPAPRKSKAQKTHNSVDATPQVPPPPGLSSQVYGKHSLPPPITSLLSPPPLHNYYSHASWHDYRVGMAGFVPGSFSNYHHSYHGTQHSSQIWHAGGIDPRLLYEPFSPQGQSQNFELSGWRG